MKFVTTQAHDPSDDLNAIIAAGGLSEDALQAITQIPAATMTRFLHEDVPSSKPGASTSRLIAEESLRVSSLSAYLSTGLSIDDNARLRGILELLTAEAHLTPANIAQLVDVDVEHVKVALIDPTTVPIDARYRLALRSSYIIAAVNQARPR